MLVLQSLIFNKYPEVVFGFSTKIDAGLNAPFYFNLSLSVGDDKEKVLKNRQKFFDNLELNGDSVAIQKQIHGNTIQYVNEGGDRGESDAMITDKPDIGLAVNTADCTPIFIYDKENRVIAGIHSGWRGTAKKILLKTIEKLRSEYNSQPENLIVYIGPSISQKSYEVGEEVAEQFDEKYLIPVKEKYLLDVSGINYDLLVDSGARKENIQRSNLCTYENPRLFHSYRHDGKKSGRSLGIIALRKI